MNRRLLFWAVTAALAGFLFGFDTVVISGAEQKIEALWGLSPGVHGLAMSMALWGTVLGALCGGWPTERYGRKSTLLWIGFLYLVSAIGSAVAPDVYTFMVARFIGGLGVGISTVAAPCYISEIAPANLRGRLAGMFQFNIVFGILIAFLSNFLLGGFGEHAWRFMLGVEAIPALIYSVLCFTLPESPRWLITHGDREGGIAVFRRIRPEAGDAEREAQADEIEAAVAHTEDAAKFLTPRLITPISLAFFIAFFNQLSGINAILYFAPRIFQLTGLDQSAALLQSVGIGVTNLVFTFVGLWLIDKLGRRTLLYIGSFGYIASLALCAWAFFAYAAPFNVAAKAIAVQEAADKLTVDDGRVQISTPGEEKAFSEYEVAAHELVGAAGDEYEGVGVAFSNVDNVGAMQKAAAAVREQASNASGAGGTTVLLCIFAFIAAHAVGQGVVIWVLISEIFPNRNRAAGQVLGSSTHWVFAALLTLFFPKAMTIFAPGQVFSFFALMMVGQLIWVAWKVPETKGFTLEEMQKKLGIDE